MTPGGTSENRLIVNYVLRSRVNFLSDEDLDSEAVKFSNHISDPQQSLPGL